MKPRDAFGVAVRMLGLIGMLYGLIGIVSAIIVASRSSDVMILAMVIIDLLYMAIGYLLLAQSEWFIKFAYGPDRLD
jgi:hypothetical protein